MNIETRVIKMKSKTWASLQILNPKEKKGEIQCP